MLFEKTGTLGGRVRIGSTPPHKAILNEFIDYLERRVRALGVSVALEREFTPDLLLREKPDGIIVATGAVSRLPDWKGIDESQVLTVDDALSNDAALGQNVLVIGDGGNGTEIADYLSEKGKKVTIVEMLETLASDLVVHLQHFLIQRLREKGVTFLTSTRVLELGKGFVIVEDASGKRKLEGFDTIVLAIGQAPNNGVYQALQGKIAELYLIGDASQPREIIDAVYEGEEIAAEI